MTEQIEMPEESMAPRGIGPQLRVAREKMGLSIKDVAEQTRISSRYIENIETGDFAELPGRTYAFGFARTYAKLVELDADDVVSLVRDELAAYVPQQGERRDGFEPGDPARSPSGGLVWFSIVAVLLLLAGLFMGYRVLFSPAAELPSLVVEQQAGEAEAEAEAQAATEPVEADVAPDPAGAVVFTATEPGVWVRFYDANGRRLMEKELARGESYTVPADVEGPQLWTGRPDALSITVGGRAIPGLAQERTTVRDVAVDAASLLARAQEETGGAGYAGI